MSQQFDPLLYLDLANELAGDPQEKKLRAAVGRAYYALFIIARDKLGITRPHDVHKVVIDTLKKRRGYAMVASELDQLRKLRTTADYQMVPVDPARRNWGKNWTDASVIVSRILNRLEQL